MEIIYREGSEADSRVAFEVFHESVSDLSKRLGIQALSGGNDPAAHENLWVGYGYLGYQHGLFALFDPNNFPMILVHAETIATIEGLGSSLDVPGINQIAIDYLFSRRCQIDTFWTHFLSNHPFGQFDRYIAMTPTFIL